jgi:hypothetical protein
MLFRNRLAGSVRITKDLNKMWEFMVLSDHYHNKSPSLACLTESTLMQEARVKKNHIQRHESPVSSKDGTLLLYRFTHHVMLKSEQGESSRASTELVAISNHYQRSK